MARLEMNSIEFGGVGQGAASADMLFRMGMMYATGRSVQPDLVTAHKWFNLAALKGHSGAADYRREIAGEMSSDELADALRAAREWMRMH